MAHWKGKKLHTWHQCEVLVCSEVGESYFIHVWWYFAECVQINLTKVGTSGKHVFTPACPSHIPCIFKPYCCGYPSIDNLANKDRNRWAESNAVTLFKCIFKYLLIHLIKQKKKSYNFDIDEGASYVIFYMTDIQFYETN